MYKKHTYVAVGTHNNGRAVVLKAKVYLSGNCGYYIMPELLFEKRETTLLPAASGGVSASVFIIHYDKWESGPEKNRNRIEYRKVCSSDRLQDLQSMEDWPIGCFSLIETLRPFIAFPCLPKTDC